MRRSGIAIVFIVMVIMAMSLGCTTEKKLSFNVKGQVDKPGTYDLNSYKDRFVTITAKLDGKVTHLPEANYTGVPLRTVLSDAGVKSGATNVTIRASDGYAQTFDLANVTANDNVILINDNDTVRVIARGFAGGMWVEQATELDVS
ncbi:MAG TPA: molybdopterin-dependent oxidoreductase [Methanocella sp.]|uniref:molybdopterin-dependent oxidoreductase n=1 Tax=Methanocella sp. TaxID=2052833 RepID=UPI002BEB9451|nr:molybdopterin-dependent oxidoreductase [Methanocella sp.]HTY90177.1 molybdopterin-dependent oxidoreductase [Methanocella sp.]